MLLMCFCPRNALELEVERIRISLHAALLLCNTFISRTTEEGFFTITTGGRSEGTETRMLPELQPFYGVLEWRHFNKSKHVKQAIKRLQKRGVAYTIKATSHYDAAGSAVWTAINEYQVERHGVNWLTKRYLDVMKAASDDPVRDQF